MWVELYAPVRNDATEQFHLLTEEVHLICAKVKLLLAQNVKQTGASKVPVTEDEKKTADKKNKKLTIGQKVKKEVQHYWDGTKLLATEFRISSRLALKMARGYELTRREHRQVSYLF